MQRESDDADEPPWAAPEQDAPPWRIVLERVTSVRQRFTAEVRTGPDEQPRPRPPPRETPLQPDARPAPSEGPAEPPRPPPARKLLSLPYEPADYPGPYTKRNYAAVEAHGGFGLVDLGSAASGVRDLVAHVPRSARGDPLRALRVGGVFEAAARGQARPLPLRVRYLTPARYYAPGRKITALALGVDDRAWRQLVVKPE